VGTMELQAEKTQRKAESGSGWYAVVARVGLVAKGLSYGLVGALALKLALGDGGKATSRQGALQSLAQHSFGKIVLFLLAAGFAAYALWRFIQAWTEGSDEHDSAWKTWGKRAAYAGRGLIYAGLTYSTIRIATGAGHQQAQNQKAHHSAGMVLSWPGGRWIVGATGLALAAVALWNLYRGLARKFEDRWRVARLTAAVRRWGSRAGVLGHVARFVVFGLIGVFVVKAALDYNPKDAIGLDGALQKLAQASYGPWLLGLTAAGLVAYGVYCLVDARLRDVSTNG
jgi:formate hydrogenlyase subunit 3/multisubunit Na+/H+ antiporter MnhD subunit